MKIGSKWGKSNHFLSRGPQASPLGSTHSGRTTGALGMGCVGILKCWGETNIPTSLEQIYRLRLVRNLSSYEGWKLPFGASLNHKKSMAKLDWSIWICLVWKLSASVLNRHPSIWRKSKSELRAPDVSFEPSESIQTQWGTKCANKSISDYQSRAQISNFLAY